MGQYWIPVNLTKGEFIHPHKLASGLKLCEQLESHVGNALIILTAAMPQQRGGGDLDLRTDSRAYNAIAKQVIGRWAGDRIAIVGDYAEDTDLPAEFEASTLYDKCHDSGHYEYNDKVKGSSYRDMTDGPNKGKYAHYIVDIPPLFKDITDLVCKVIEHELGGKFKGDGWRKFTRNGEDEARA